MGDFEAPTQRRGGVIGEIPSLYMFCSYVALQLPLTYELVAIAGLRTVSDG